MLESQINERACYLSGSNSSVKCCSNVALSLPLAIGAHSPVRCWSSGGNVAGHKMAVAPRNGGGWAGPAPREAGDAQQHRNKEVR